MAQPRGGVSHSVRFEGLSRLLSSNEVTFIGACIDHIMEINDKQTHGTVAIRLRDGRCDLLETKETRKAHDL